MDAFSWERSREVIYRAEDAEITLHFINCVWIGGCGPLYMKGFACEPNIAMVGKTDEQKVLSTDFCKTEVQVY